MGDNTLQTIVPGASKPNDVNQYKTALSGDILPRNANGEVEDGAGSLGSSSRPFTKLYIKESINVDGVQGGFCPAGVMLPYTASETVAPPGWIFADGKTIGNIGSGADYEGEEFRYLFNLYRLVSNYGNAGAEDFNSGDTVKTPNPNGNFIRSMGSADPSIRTMGSTQSSQNLSHAHTFRTFSSGTDSAGVGGSAGGTTTTSSSGGSEARPINMAFPYIIKV